MTNLKHLSVTRALPPFIVKGSRMIGPYLSTFVGEREAFARYRPEKRKTIIRRGLKKSLSLVLSATATMMRFTITRTLMFKSGAFGARARLVVVLLPLVAACGPLPAYDITGPCYRVTPAEYHQRTGVVTYGPSVEMCPVTRNP